MAIPSGGDARVRRAQRGTGRHEGGDGMTLIEVNSIATLALSKMHDGGAAGGLPKMVERGKEQWRSLRMRTVSDNNIVAELDCYI